MKSKERMILMSLVLGPDFPHSFTTEGDVSELLGVTKKTARKYLKRLIKKGYINKVSSYYSFYFPVKEKVIKSKPEIFKGVLN